MFLATFITRELMSPQPYENYIYKLRDGGEVKVESNFKYIQVDQDKHKECEIGSS